MYPKVKFKFNKELDKQMALVFLDLSNQGGVNFSDGVVGVHPELADTVNIKNKEEKKRIISIHFDSFYLKHEDYLKKRLREFEKDWGKIEKDFFEEVMRLFKNHKFPKGKYEGYISIINCNPRFLDDKTFQIFYSHPAGSNYIAIHEILHFFFYDYVIKKYSKIFKKLDTERGIFWDLAELFNAVILDLPEFVALHGETETKPYPVHEKYLASMKKLWEDEQSVDGWVTKAYAYLNSKK